MPTDEKRTRKTNANRRTKSLAGYKTIKGVLDACRYSILSFASMCASHLLDEKSDKFNCNGKL